MSQAAAIDAATRPLILGLLLVLVLRFRPEGLSSERSAFRFSEADLLPDKTSETKAVP